MDKYYAGLIKFLLVGTLIFSPKVCAQQRISIPLEWSIKRVIYLNEQDQIFFVFGDKDVPYKEIKILKGNKEVQMNPAIDYQYQKIKPKLSFKGKMKCVVAPISTPNPITRTDGKPYSELEKEVINRLYEKDILYPCQQITDALKKSNIKKLANGDKWYVTFSADEDKRGYENIFLEKLDKF